MRDEEQRAVDEIADELKRPVRVDTAFEGRVMAAVRRLPVHRRLGLWARALRPRTLTLRPLPFGIGAMAAAAGLFVLMLPAVRAFDRQVVAPRTAAGRAHAVQFVLVAPTARKVAVVGDFNDWDRDSAYAATHEGGGVWAVTARIPTGHHRYAFVVDDSLWMADPAASRVVDGDFGTTSSALVVGENF